MKLNTFSRLVGERVNADDDAGARLDCSLEPVSSLLYLSLDEPCLDRGDGAAEIVDPVDQLESIALELRGQRFDVVRAAERVGGVGCARLVHQDLLRPQDAIVAACWLGSARASSKLFVCSDCAPPQTAESAWIATRTTLFSGCCAVRVEPPVCAWNRSAWAVALVAPNQSRMIRAHIVRAARNFATSTKKSLCALKKNDRSMLPNASGERRAATSFVA